MHFVLSCSINLQRRYQKETNHFWKLCDYRDWRSFTVWLLSWSHSGQEPSEGTSGTQMVNKSFMSFGSRPLKTFKVMISTDIIIHYQKMPKLLCKNWNPFKNCIFSLFFLQWADFYWTQKYFPFKAVKWSCFHLFPSAHCFSLQQSHVSLLLARKQREVIYI